MRSIRRGILVLIGCLAGFGAFFYAPTPESVYSHLFFLGMAALLTHGFWGAGEAD